MKFYSKKNKITLRMRWQVRSVEIAVEEMAIESTTNTVPHFLQCGAVEDQVRNSNIDYEMMNLR